MEEKIPYWRSSDFWRVWVEKKGIEGCVICTDQEVKLSLDRKPPLQRHLPLERKKAESANNHRTVMKSLLLTAIKCMTALVVITLTLGGGLFYLSEANQRRAVSEQEWNYEYSDLPDAKYLAKVAYLGGGNVLLQLCDISSKEILVERTFLYPEAVRLVWDEDSLLYDSDDGSIFHRGTIQFPPTWIDRLLTYVP